MVNLDKLTYAGNLANLAALAGDARHALRARRHRRRARWSSACCAEHRPRAVVHFAAESHVDRSIHGPAAFVQTNVVGTFTLLEAARAYWAALAAPSERGVPLPARLHRRGLRLARAEPTRPSPRPRRTRPTARTRPRRPARDHLVRAYHHTYGLPVAHHQLLEQLRAVPVSREADPAHDRQRARGQAAAGLRRRPAGARLALRRATTARRSARCSSAGGPGETYNIGGDAERRNLEVVHALCDALAGDAPARRAATAGSITFVADRPGHDRRYAIDARKIRGELGWRAARDASRRGLAKTVRWYLEHADWVAQVQSGEYRQWIETNYAAQERGVSRRASSSPAARARGCTRPRASCPSSCCRCTTSRWSTTRCRR